MSQFVPENEMEKQRIIELLNRRRRLRYIATAIFSLIIIAYVVLSTQNAFQQWEIPGYYITYGIPAIAVIYAGLTFWKWRCPVCGKYLGRRFTPPKCIKCGTVFQENGY